MPINKSILTVLILLFSAGFASAQEGTWEVGIAGGAAGYMGDLNQNNPLQISGVSAGVFAKRNFNPYLGFRANYAFGQVSADDAKSSNEQFRDRNLRFKTTLNEFTGLLEFNFFDYKPSGGNRRFSPYLFTGVGLVIFQPTAKYNGEKYRLDRLSTEGQENGYKNAVVTIPYGGGVKYNYKDTWNVFAEIGYRTPLTDYIDDVSGVYPVNPKFVGNPAVNLTNPADPNNPNYNNIGKPGTQRGDFRKRDTYLFVSVGISFTFVSSKCYSF